MAILGYRLLTPEMRESPARTNSSEVCTQNFQRIDRMSERLPAGYLARHGETAWSISGQHTGLTDLPLTERGERNARRLGDRLRGLGFTKILTSPLQRTIRTCELAGFGKFAQVRSEERRVGKECRSR